MALAKSYVRSADVVGRQVMGETFLVPIRGQLADLQYLFRLDPVADHIWQRLDGEHDLHAIRESIVASFEVEPAQAETDMLEFIAQLHEAGLVAEVVR